MAELKELHFRIGAGFGLLLMQIAQEHLLYNYNIQKALNTLADLPPELQLKVLKGDYVMHVDEETQQLLVGEREEGVDDEYPKIDMLNWYTKNSVEIISSGMELKKAIDEMLWHMKYKRVYKVYDYSTIIDFLTTGDSKQIIDDLMESEDISQLALLIDVTRRYLEKSMKIQSVMDWMKKTYPEEFEGTPNWKEHIEVLGIVTRKFNDLIRCDLSEVQRESEVLDNYIEAAQEINEVLSKGIEPVNILDNWSAGWLAPNGDYYALNGEIANMLHNQIADALQEKGLIPMYESEKEEEIDMKINPDAWLEQHGWVKIHGNNINFAGTENHRLGKKNVQMTRIQIEKIRDYITNCHQCLILAGWRRERQSIGMFTSMALNDFEGLSKKYFEY